MAFNKEWMKMIDHTTREYREGVDSFLNFAFSNIVEDDDTPTIRCPCDKCRNLIFKKKCDVRFDLLKFGMYENYTTWDLHGENTNASSSGSHTNMENSDEIDSDDSGLNMLQDAFGIPGMHFEGDDENDDESDNDSNGKPKGEAAKEHKIMLEQENPRNVDRRHKMQFTRWIYDRLRKNQVL
ncbi:V-type ATP synthase beta chain [Bienertia sinuspersici]